MSDLEEEIALTRWRIITHDASGHASERALEEARLGGLLTALHLTGTGAVGCLHPVHNAAGLGEDGRTIWRCVDCGEVAPR